MVSKVGSDGIVLEPKWADQLRQPMGMRAFAGRLWVNNKDEIVGIMLKNEVLFLDY